MRKGQFSPERKHTRRLCWLPYAIRLNYLRSDRENPAFRWAVSSHFEKGKVENERFGPFPDTFGVRGRVCHAERRTALTLVRE